MPLAASWMNDQSRGNKRLTQGGTSQNPRDALEQTTPTAGSLAIWDAFKRLRPREKYKTKRN